MRGTIPRRIVSEDLISPAWKSPKHPGCSPTCSRHPCWVLQRVRQPIADCSVHRMHEPVAMRNSGLSPTAASHASAALRSRQTLPAAAQPELRPYQQELLDVAKQHNVIIYLDTGSGKTRIAQELMLHKAAHLRAAGQVAIMLCPTIPLVLQQGDVLRRAGLKVGRYCSDLKHGFWHYQQWQREAELNQVWVMTPHILLHALAHAVIKVAWIGLLVFDEAHHASKGHPYALIMEEFCNKQAPNEPHPHVLGLTASPRHLDDLERTLGARLLTVQDRSEVEALVPAATTEVVAADQSEECSEVTSVVIELKACIELLTKAHEYGSIKDALARRQQLDASIACVVAASTASVELGDISEGQLDFGSNSSSAGSLKRQLAGVLVCLQQLGPWAALLAWAKDVLSPHESLASDLGFEDLSMHELGELMEPADLLMTREEATARLSYLEDDVGEQLEGSLEDLPPDFASGTLAEACMHVALRKACAALVTLAFPGQTSVAARSGAVQEFDACLAQGLTSKGDGGWQVVGEQLLKTLPVAVLEQQVLGQPGPEIGAWLHAGGVELVTPRAIQLVTQVFQHRASTFHLDCNAKHHSKGPSMSGVEEWSAMIFVQQKIVCMAVSALFNILPSLQGSLQARHFVGNTGGGLSMDYKEQTVMINDFSSGAFNVLVATSVGSEGMDFRQCQLVVAFDLPGDVTAMVQCRGRARKAGAKYILTYTLGDLEQQRCLARLMGADLKGGEEKKMQLEAERRAASHRISLLNGAGPLPQPAPVPALINGMNNDASGPYYVAATGACIPARMAGPLLLEFCVALPGNDRFTILQPFYTFRRTSTANEHRFTARVFLPSNAPILSSVSRPHSKKMDAKAQAALIALAELHRWGALDDHMIPVWTRKSGFDIDNTAQGTPPSVTLTNELPACLAPPGLQHSPALLPSPAASCSAMVPVTDHNTVAANGRCTPEDTADTVSTSRANGHGSFETTTMQFTEQSDKESTEAEQQQTPDQQQQQQRLPTFLYAFVMTPDTEDAAAATPSDTTPSAHPCTATPTPHSAPQAMATVAAAAAIAGVTPTCVPSQYPARPTSPFTHPWGVLLHHELPPAVIGETFRLWLPGYATATAQLQLVADAEEVSRLPVEALLEFHQVALSMLLVDRKEEPFDAGTWCHQVRLPRLHHALSTAPFNAQLPPLPSPQSTSHVKRGQPGQAPSISALPKLAEEPWYTFVPLTTAAQNKAVQHCLSTETPLHTNARSAVVCPMSSPPTNTSGTALPSGCTPCCTAATAVDWQLLLQVAAGPQSLVSLYRQAGLATPACRTPLADVTDNDSYTAHAPKRPRTSDGGSPSLHIKCGHREPTDGQDLQQLLTTTGHDTPQLSWNSLRINSPTNSPTSHQASNLHFGKQFQQTSAAQATIHSHASCKSANGVASRPSPKLQMQAPSQLVPSWQSAAASQHAYILQYQPPILSNSIVVCRHTGKWLCECDLLMGTGPDYSFPDPIKAISYRDYYVRRYGVPSSWMNSNLPLLQGAPYRSIRHHLLAHPPAHKPPPASVPAVAGADETAVHAPAVTSSPAVATAMGVCAEATARARAAGLACAPPPPSAPSQVRLSSAERSVDLKWSTAQPPVATSSYAHPACGMPSVALSAPIHSTTQGPVDAEITEAQDVQSAAGEAAEAPAEGVDATDMGDGTTPEDMQHMGPDVGSSSSEEEEDPEDGTHMPLYHAYRALVNKLLALEADPTSSREDITTCQAAVSEAGAAATAEARLELPTTPVRRSFGLYNQQKVPLELCMLMPLPRSALDTLKQVPVLMHRVEAMAAAEELARVVTPPQLVAMQPPLTQFMWCLTAQSVHDLDSLERHEFLGDAVLKYLASAYLYVNMGAENEGVLSCRKVELISNKVLLQKTTTLSLNRYLRTEAFQNLQHHIRTRSGCSSQDRVQRGVKGKRLADMVEALIGAFYTSTGGLAGAAMLCEHIGILPVGAWAQIQGLGSKAVMLKKWQSPDAEAAVIGFAKNDAPADMETVNSPAVTAPTAVPAVGLVNPATAPLLAATASAAAAAVTDVCVQGLQGQEDPKVHGVSKVQRQPVLMILPKPAPDAGAGSATAALCWEDANAWIVPRGDYVRLQEALGYRFKDLALLREALTHCSWPRPPCYQRLEFLGDAVLDLLVTHHIMGQLKDGTPGQLTKTRERWVSGADLAVHCAAFGLHRHARIGSKTLTTQIAVYTSNLQAKVTAMYEAMAVEAASSTAVAGGEGASTTGGPAAAAWLMDKPGAPPDLRSGPNSAAAAWLMDKPGAPPNLRGGPNPAAEAAAANVADAGGGPAAVNGATQEGQAESEVDIGACKTGRSSSYIVPKVMADLIESVLGAVYVDCKHDLPMVWQVFSRLCARSTWRQVLFTRADMRVHAQRLEIAQMARRKRKEARKAAEAAFAAAAAEAETAVAAAAGHE